MILLEPKIYLGAVDSEGTC